MTVNFGNTYGSGYAAFLEPVQTQTPVDLLAKYQDDALSDEDFKRLLVNQDDTKHDPIENLTTANLDDALSEEDFQRLLVNQDDTVNAPIENRATAILIHLQTLVDGIKRDDIEKGTLCSEKDALDASQETSLNAPGSAKAANAFDYPYASEEREDSFSDHRFDPFMRDTNFDDQDYIKRPADSAGAVKNLIISLASIIFGIDFSDKTSKDTRSFAEQEIGLKDDRNLWEDELRNYYKSNYHRNVNEAFSRAEKLISERKSYAKYISYHRFTLLATTIISIVGFTFQKQLLAYVSGGAAVVTFVSMVAYYGSSSFKQDNLASGLKTTIDHLEKIGSTNWIAKNHPLLSYD